MPTIKTVFGHEVDVDEDEAEVLRRQGLVASEEPAPRDEPAAYDVTAPGVSSTFAPGGYPAPPDDPEPEPETAKPEGDTE